MQKDRYYCPNSIDLIIILKKIIINKILELYVLNFINETLATKNIGPIIY